MITFNAFGRIFQIKSATGTATAFSVDENGRQYLVTALHVLPEPVNEVQLRFKDAWKTIPVTLTGRGNKDIDVVVYSPSFRIAPDFELPLTKGLMILGQDVYFLGFPYGITSEVNDPGWHLPYPLIKKACISGRINKGNGKIWLLDGINNPGFSGGPVVFYPINPRDNKLRIMGVISGFKFSPEPLFSGEEETDYFVKANTGIVYATCAGHVLDIIESNPNGLIITG